MHRRVTGSAGFDPPRKQWTVILRLAPRSAFDGAGEDAARRYWKWRKCAKAYVTLLEAKETPKEVVLSSVYWMDPLSWLSRALTSRSSVS